MAIRTVALGITIGAKDAASKVLRGLTSKVDSLSGKLETATRSGRELATSMEEGKTFMESLGDVLMPVKKIILWPFSLLKKMIKAGQGLYDQLLEARVGFLQMEEGAYRMGSAFLEASTQLGIANEEFFAMRRQIGGMVDSEDELTDATIKAATLMRAFGMAADQSLALVRMSQTMAGSTEALDDLGAEILAFQKIFRLPELMDEMSGVAELTRRGTLLLNTTFGKKLSPTMAGISKITATLTTKLGMMGKEAAQLAIGTVERFQRMAFNLRAVFVGVEDDFGSQTEAIMELFVRTGQGAQKAFSTIREAAEGNFEEIAKAFVETQEQGGIAAERMRVLFLKEFGDEIPTILEGLSDTNKVLREQFEKYLPKGISKAAQFQRAQQRLLERAEVLADSFKQFTQNLGAAMGLGTNFGDVITGVLGKLRGWAISVQNFWAGLVEDTDKTLGGAVKKFYEKYISPMMDEIKKGIDEALTWIRGKASEWLVRAAESLDLFLSEVIGPWIDKAILEFKRMWVEIGEGIGVLKDVVLWFQKAKAETGFAWAKIWGNVEKGLTAWGAAAAQDFTGTMDPGAVIETAQKEYSRKIEEAANRAYDVYREIDALETARMKRRKELEEAEARYKRGEGIRLKTAEQIRLKLGFQASNVDLNGNMKINAARIITDTRFGPILLPD
jgi:hypothetical protein